MDPLDQIRLAGVTALGYHGVYEDEKRQGQDFVVDVVLHLDTRPAAQQDDVAYTVNYGDVAERLVELIGADPVDLVETLAQRIATDMLRHSLVRVVEVTVHKPQAPITVPFGDVSVTITRHKERA